MTKIVTSFPSHIAFLRSNTLRLAVGVLLLLGMSAQLRAQTSDALAREIAQIEARLEQVKNDQSASARLEARRLRITLDEKRIELSRLKQREAASLALRELDKAAPVDGIQYLRDTFRFVMSTPDANGGGSQQRTREAWEFIGRIMTQRTRGQLVRVSGFICRDIYAEQVLDYEKTFNIVPHSYHGSPMEIKVCFPNGDCTDTPVARYDRQNKALIPVFKLTAREALRSADIDEIRPFRCAGAGGTHEGSYGWSEVKVEGILDGGFFLDCGAHSGCRTVTHYFIKDWVLISNDD